VRLFPFSAIVGQDLLKKGLLVNAVDPTIGGILIRGEKGTGKTTAVRAFGSGRSPRFFPRRRRYRAAGSAVFAGFPGARSARRARPPGRLWSTRSARWRWWTFR